MQDCTIGYVTIRMLRPLHVTQTYRWNLQEWPSRTIDLPSEDVAVSMASSNGGVVGRNGQRSHAATFGSLGSLTDDDLESLMIIETEDQAFRGAHGNQC